MTDSHANEVIKRLRQRVDRAPHAGFLTVETEHMRILFHRLRELEDPVIDADDLVVQSDADGVVAAVLMQSHAASAPGDFG